MDSGNDDFLISTVVVMMVMRGGKATNTNMVMVPRHNYLLVPMAAVVNGDGNDDGHGGVNV